MCKKHLHTRAFFLSSVRFIDALCWFFLKSYNASLASLNNTLAPTMDGDGEDEGYNSHSTSRLLRQTHTPMARSLEMIRMSVR